MKIFITGGNGQLAFELTKITQQIKGCQFVAPTKNEFDLTQESHFQMIKDYKPDVIINTAAFTKVDLAEVQKEYAYAVNGIGVMNLVMISQQLKCYLVHLSTDYVFDGHNNKPYKETDITHPINTYGASKLKGEEILREQYEQHMILRVSAVFGQHGHNFVKSIVDIARRNDSLRIVNDQITGPTPAKNIAQTLLHMINNPHPGTYHYRGSEPITWYEFAKRITNKMGITIPIEAIRTEQLSLPAKRPLYSVLDCDKLEKTFGITMPCWETELIDVINSISAT